MATNKMNRRIKKLWVKALRSGKYKQGHGRLRNSRGEYCCLGVLCDLHARSLHKKRPCSEGYMGSTFFVPNTVQEWAGVDRSPKCGDDLLVNYNDKDGLPFSEIADLIEEHL